MNKLSILGAAAAFALAATPLVAQTSKEQTKSQAQKSSVSAQEFVTKAASGGMFEVESSKLAGEKAKREDVKSFARKMVDDHGKANAELKDVAGKAGLKVPEKMEQKQQAQLDKLQKAPAASFDSAYIDAQDEAHREAVSLFETYAKAGENTELKQFATKTLPVLQSHAAEIKQLEKASGATGKSSGGSGPGSSGKAK